MRRSRGLAVESGPILLTEWQAADILVRRRNHPCHPQRSPLPAARAAPSQERTPAVGFVSLGCAKALVDSERMITELRARGYDISSSYRDADLVVVNTCGFIESAIDESLQAIGEALEQHGRVLVTGCLGANPQRILERHPKVLGVTGPHAYERVIAAVDQHLPAPHAPFIDLVPPQGIRLTPRHYAYLKISEGCNNRCSFCIIPALRGDLVSRPLDDVMREAEALAASGVRELLVISQDTSAYGSDIRYRGVSWRGEPYSSRIHRARARARRARGLGAAALRLSLPARRRLGAAHERARRAAVPRHSVPARQPHGAQAHAPPGAQRGHAAAHRALARAARRI